VTSRLFTFGCSFTNYRWSTWADCLAPEFTYFENWGQSGAGNHYIFNSIMEADQRHNFSTGDTVVVCWTNVMREDRYTDRWQTLGNVTTCPIYNPDYVRDAVTERGCLIRDLAMIKATQVLLKQKRNVRWRFLSMCSIGNLQQFDDQESEHQDVLSLYQSVLNSVLPSYRQTVFAHGWRDAEDPHPTPAEHLAYLDAVLPGWVTKAETRVKMHEESINLNKDPRKSGMAKVTRL
jgi:hypothetical protein